MKDLEFKIVRSAKRKKLTITVERDRSVVVRVPADTADEAVHRLIDSKRRWLFDKLHHPQKYQDQVHPPGKEVVSGESAPYLGKDYRIEIAETKSGEVEFSDWFTVPVSHQSKRREALPKAVILALRQNIPSGARVRLPTIHELAKRASTALI